MMKNYKKISTLYCISAVLFNLAAIITFVSGNRNSMGVVYLCLGSTFLCLGSSYAKKAKKDEDDKEKTE